jgi:hypothetical protein
LILELIFTLKSFAQLTFARIYPNINHFNLKLILVKINFSDHQNSNRHRQKYKKKLIQVASSNW